MRAEPWRARVIGTDRDLRQSRCPRRQEHKSSKDQRGLRVPVRVLQLEIGLVLQARVPIELGEDFRFARIERRIDAGVIGF